MTAACAGGWCSVRENCKHYHAEGLARRHPVERLCEPKTITAFELTPHDAFERRVVPIIRRKQEAA